MKIEVPMSPWEGDENFPTVDFGSIKGTARKPTPYRVRSAFNEKSPDVKSFRLERTPLAVLDNESEKLTEQMDLISFTPPPNMDIEKNRTPILKGAEKISQKCNSPVQHTCEELDLLSHDSFLQSSKPVEKSTDELDALREKIAYLENELRNHKHVTGSLQAREVEVAALRKELEQVNQTILKSKKLEMEKEKEMESLKQELSNLQIAFSSAQSTFRREIDHYRDVSSVREAALLDRIKKLKHLMQEAANEKEVLLQHWQRERSLCSAELDVVQKRMATLEAERRTNLSGEDLTDSRFSQEKMNFLRNENDILIRKLRYVSSKLISHQSSLDSHVPPMGYLSKELRKWIEKDLKT